MVSRNPMWRMGVAERPNNRRPEFNVMKDEMLAETDREAGAANP